MERHFHLRSSILELAPAAAVTTEAVSTFALPILPQATATPGDIRWPPGFHVMIKPRGPVCNLHCEYCFYLDKEQLFAADTSFRMSDEVLEAFTRQYIRAQQFPEVTFGWQGGEPTLMGLDFFRKAVGLQRQYAPAGMKVQNAFQTNGILLDDQWCEFFRECNFLVGLSLDGPADLHDVFRRDRGGHGTFARVHKALKLMQRHGVEVNILCVVNCANGDHGRRVYRFFRDEGVQFIQIIPAIARAADGQVTPWSVRPEQLGDFLCSMFDVWVKRDVGRIFIQHFDQALAVAVGMEPSLCVHARACGTAVAMEHSGDVFSCDHFVAPAYLLGNVREADVADLVGSGFQRQFGQNKRGKLPAVCRSCDVLRACNGGCPKDRFATAPDGQPGLNYLCAGYKQFFTHSRPAMAQMAGLLRVGRAPAEIMNSAPERPSDSRVGRNDPCPCRSGRKYKKCCGP